MAGLEFALAAGRRTGVAAALATAPAEAIGLAARAMSASLCALRMAGTDSERPAALAFPANCIAAIESPPSSRKPSSAPMGSLFRSMCRTSAHSWASFCSAAELSWPDLSPPVLASE